MDRGVLSMKLHDPEASKVYFLPVLHPVLQSPALAGRRRMNANKILILGETPKA